MNKKLIEVALPLDDINAACVREKSIRHGHPSTLHLWWARRPLASARAVTFASLVDDPSSHPEEFPTEAAQARERERLFNIIRDLVVWENSNNEEVLAKAKAEIMKSTGNNPPAFLDPFAGGGALPLEAQRLGLKTYATDLNPVAVMINKAMIEIPAKYQDLPPINPGNRENIDIWPMCTGLANDVNYYGKMLKQKAFEKIGNLYPKYHLKDGTNRELTVIAWLWSRTVPCQNPACSKPVPLLKSYDISTKKKNEHHIEISFTNGKVVSTVKQGASEFKEGTISRGKGICPWCREPFDSKYVMTVGKKKTIGLVPIAVVCDGPNGREYFSPDMKHIDQLQCVRPDYIPDLYLEGKAKEPSSYGFESTSELFTDRQIVLLTTLIDLLDEIEIQVNRDIPSDDVSHKNYAAAIRTYLAFVIDKMADYHSSFCSWHTSRETLKHVLSLQAIPMVWDFAEANPFSNSSGCLENMIEWVVKSILTFPFSNSIGQVAQWDATQDNGLRNIMISTDPPYYDNICYADLSDFFYVWMRESLRNTYPDVFSSIQTPKKDELIASPFRFKKKAEAKSFFEAGMDKTCRNLFEYSREDIPVTIYYAFKQTEMDDDEKVSSGWETMLTAIINAGFTITGTWPMRTELVTALKHNVSALSTSVVIVCRKEKRKDSITMRQFLDTLKAETVSALAKLQQASIAPVDLAQSAIGPGIAVYSRYESVIKSDGTKLSVREALKLINHELDSHLTASIGSIDSETSYCLSLYAQKAFNEIGYGDAETLAKAKNVSVADLAGLGVLDSAKGKVSLRVREDLPEFKNNREEACLWLVTQQVVNYYRTKGYEGVAEIFNKLSEGTIEKIKSLCYQLFNIADNNGWAQEALAYNEMITTWDSTISVARELKTKKKEVQLELF